MANLLKAVILILSVNVVLFLAQASMLEMNPSGNTVFNCTGSTMAALSDCGNSLEQNPQSTLPEGNTGVDPTTGNIFTDSFSSVKNWLIDATGLDYVFSMLSAPKDILEFVGVPAPIAFVVGVLWYGTTLFIIISFMFGRGGE